MCVSTCGKDGGQPFFDRFPRTYKLSEKPSGCIKGKGPSNRDCVCDTDFCNGLASEDVPDCPIQSDRDGGTNAPGPGPSPNSSERVLRLPPSSLDYWNLIMTALITKLQIK